MFRDFNFSALIEMINWSCIGIAISGPPLNMLPYIDNKFQPAFMLIKEQ